MHCKIGFDSSHNNKLIIEDTAFSDFVQYFINSNFKLGKIEAGITYEKLSVYDVFIVGVPTDSKILFDEIFDLVRYVSDGGSLLVVNDQGGDHASKNNLSKLTQNFGISFNSDRLYDSLNFSKKNSRPIIKDFKKHFITRNISEYIHSNGCTIKIDKSVEENKIDVDAIAFSSEDTSSRSYYNASINEWVDERASSAPIIGTSHYGLGKIVTIGSLSLFSNLHESYGIRAADNQKLISNIIAWLLNKAYSEEAKSLVPVYLTIPLEQDLFYWIKEKIDNGKWNSVKEIMNFALRIVKIRMKKERNIKDKEKSQSKVIKTQ